MSPDFELLIATAGKRNSLNWLTRKTTWQALIDLCRAPKRTPESMAQYLAMTKEQQGNAKDVGGFVGGALRGKRRKKDAVASRCLITLDLDHASPSFWSNFQRIYRGTAAFIYSTHSHTPESPRLRLIIPLTRAIEPAAYEPIARSVAHDLDIEQFDDTTYDPSRLMYFPSCPQDAEFIFELQEGRPLDPEVVLSGYDDWRDAEEWPTSSRETKRVFTGIRKMEDPMQKDGVIGDFCRIFPIREAIERFLSEIYEPGADENRYTYRAGTTANGLVIYDNRFAHAFQATDPLSGPHSYNAFDLVRIHLFGKLDKAESLELPVTERPSYKRMVNFVYQDAKFREAMLERQLESARSDFAGLSPEQQREPDEDDTWKEKLERTKTGEMKQSQRNFILLLGNSTEFRDKLWFDEFEHRIKVAGGLPWDSQFIPDRVLSSEDYSQINTYFVMHYGFGLSRVNLLDTVVTVAKSRARNPLREYLDALRWDGTPRLDTLFVDFLAAKDTPLIRALTRKHLVAAVKRAYEPGCKYDNVIIFTGDQGAGKSTLIARLGGQWAKPMAAKFDGRESIEQLMGAWILESEELRGWKGAELESIKAFFSRTSDRMRPAYGMATNDYPRQCIFFATTNDAVFLNDTTGNRRFWPIAVHKGKAKYDVWRDFTEHYRDQIWAEAIYFYRQGESTFLTPQQEQELWDEQSAFTDSYFMELVATVKEYLDTPLPPEWYMWTKQRRKSYFTYDAGEDMTANIRRDKVCWAEIRNECLRGEKFCGRTPTITELVHVMRELNEWERSLKPLRFGNGYGLQRGYVRRIDELEDPDSDIL